MTIFAVVDGGGLITNRVERDGAEWSPPAGSTAVEDTAGTMDIGGTFIGGVYTPPAYPPPPSYPVVQIVDANARLDAGISAAISTVEDARDTLHAIPSGFTPANFAQFLLQMKVVMDAFVAMLQAQAAPPAPPPP